MRTPSLLILLLSLSGCFFPGRAAAREPGEGVRGKYELWGALIAPFVHLLAEETRDPNRAMELRLRLESMTGLPPEMRGAKASVALEFPDKLRLNGPLFGEEITLGRHGDSLWVSPKGRLEPLMEAASAAGRLSAPDRKYRLGDFCLPFSDQQMVLLPALFQVKEYAAEEVDGVSCRVLEVELMEELGKALGGGWKALVWVGADQKPVKVQLERKEWQASFRVETLRFVPALPRGTWEPGAGMEGETLRLEPWQYRQLLDLVGGARVGKKKKK